MPLSHDPKSIGFMREGTYTMLDNGETYTGKPDSIIMGAVPVTWDYEGRIIETPEEATLFKINGRVAVFGEWSQLDLRGKPLQELLAVETEQEIDLLKRRLRFDFIEHDELIEVYNSALAQLDTELNRKFLPEDTTSLKPLRRIAMSLTGIYLENPVSEAIPEHIEKQIAKFRFIGGL